ncbi:MAG: YezD family protein [Opitutaceae bacterium]|nr:YezD family protein [Opitutaceae bacterium]
MSSQRSPLTTSTQPDWLEIVRSKVESLSYGVVQIVVHDGKVTQIERTDKTRLDAPGGETPRRRET